jgi:hypothetical protein
MKKTIVLLFLLCGSVGLQAQDPITEVIKAGIKKVIQAVDLKIQRLQNETILLQNAQKLIENTVSDLHLKDVSAWVEKQRTLYADYFEELQKVKTAVAYYHKVRELIEKQSLILKSYQSHFSIFKTDPHFNTNDLAYIRTVYEGIMENSISNVERVTKVLTSFTVSMTDAQRMQIIDEAAKQIHKNYSDLQSFGQRTKQIAVKRAADQKDIKRLNELYGIQ